MRNIRLNALEGGERCKAILESTLA